MKIEKLILENFRVFKDKTVIEFDDLTAFIGKNDIGKSTILEALDIFFNEKDAQVKLDKEDISKGSNNNIVTIGVVFKDHPKKIIVDASAKTSLKDEYLLNKDDSLEIRKTFPNGDTKKVKTYIVANHPVNEPLKDLLTLKISELKRRASDLGIDLSDKDKRVASAIRKKIRDNFNKDEIQRKEVEIPIDKEGGKQIWEKLKDYLPVYALFKSDRENLDQDTEVQDPVKIAIKKLLHEGEIKSKLDEIAEGVKKEISGITNGTIEKLREMNPEIAQELKPVIPDPKWESAFKGITISSDKDIPLNKRGSGVRRLILLNFFRAEAEKKKNERNVPDIIYAFEEPETSQHPEYQKKLVEAFLELSKKNDTQIILTTHSPGIAGLLPVDSLRFLRKENDKVVIESGSDDVLEKIAKDLGVLPSIDKANSVKLILYLEGPTDVEFFKRIGSVVEDGLKIDFEKDSRIIAMPVGGSTLKYWVDNHYLKKLGLPEVHIYDGDKEENRRKIEEVTKQGNVGFVTSKREIENYVHPKIIENLFEKLTAYSIIDYRQANWLEKWDQLDVAKEIKNKDVHLREKRIKEKICTEGASKMTVDLLKELNAYEEVKKWFKAMKDKM